MTVKFICIPSPTLQNGAPMLSNIESDEEYNKAAIAFDTVFTECTGSRSCRNAFRVTSPVVFKEISCGSVRVIFPVVFKEIFCGSQFEKGFLQNLKKA